MATSVVTSMPATAPPPTSGAIPTLARKTTVSGASATALNSVVRLRTRSRTSARTRAAAWARRPARGASAVAGCRMAVAVVMVAGSLRGISQLSAGEGGGGSAIGGKGGVGGRSGEGRLGVAGDVVVVLVGDGEEGPLERGVAGLEVCQRLPGGVGTLEERGERDLQVARLQLHQAGAGAAGGEQRGKAVERAGVGEVAGGGAVADPGRLPGDDLLHGAKIGRAHV